MLVLASSCTTVLMFLKSDYASLGAVFEQGRTPALVVPNDMLLGIIFLPVLVATFFNENRVIWKIIAISIVAILVVAIYLVDSRICFLTAVMMVLVCLFHFRRKQFFISGFIFLISLFFADLFLQLGIVENFMLLRNENARLSIWFAGLTRWADHPLLGFGPSNFEVAYRLGISSMELPDWIMVEPRMVPWAHNIYIEALVERGFIGLTTQLLLFWLIFVRIWQRYKATANKLRAFYFALLVSYSGLLFAGLFEPTMQRIWVSNSIFIFLGLAYAPISLQKGYRQIKS